MIFDEPFSRYRLYKLIEHLAQATGPQALRCCRKAEHQRIGEMLQQLQIAGAQDMLTFIDYNKRWRSQLVKPSHSGLNHHNLGIQRAHIACIEAFGNLLAELFAMDKKQHIVAFGGGHGGDGGDNYRFTTTATKHAAYSMVTFSESVPGIIHQIQLVRS